MTSRLNEFRAAVPAAIRATMPELRTCESQLGRFDLDRLETTSLRTPAVFVGIVAAPLSSNPNDTSSAMLDVAAFAIAEGAEAKRDDAAWAIAEGIAALLRRNRRWGMADIAGPDKIRLQPVLSAAISRRGVSVVAVQWMQKLNGIGAAILENGVLPAEAYLNDEPVDLASVFTEGTP